MSAHYTSAVCHKHCMTVASVLYRSAIPHCNSDVVNKVGRRQVASVQKLYDRHVSNLHVGGRQVGNSVHRTHQPIYHRPVLYSVFVSHLSTVICLPIPWYLPTAHLSTTNLSTYVLLFMHYLSTADLSTVYLFLCICQLADCLPPTCPSIL